MNEIFSNFGNVIILYSPVVLAYITQIIDWCVTLRSFKRLDVKKQVAPVLEQVTDCAAEIKKLNAKVEKFSKEKEELIGVIDNLKASVLEQKNETAELKEYLKKLVHENIDLKATLRREFQCAVTEQNNV